MIREEIVAWGINNGWKLSEISGNLWRRVERFGKTRHIRLRFRKSSIPVFFNLGERSKIGNCRPWS